MRILDGLSLACSGFLLAVLWMDLIFDSQVRSVRGGELPEPILASIAAYYRRATTTSRPMSRLIAAVMVILLGTLVFRGLRGDEPVMVTAVSVVLAAGPIVLALLRTLPHAVRLGARSDGPVEQSQLARSIFRDHIACLLAISALLAVLLVW
jgi:hypothetical protein